MPARAAISFRPSALVQRAEDVSRGGAAPFRTGGTVFNRDENPDWYSALADQVGKAKVFSGEFVEKARDKKHTGIYGLGEWREVLNGKGEHLSMQKIGG